MREADTIIRHKIISIRKKLINDLKTICKPSEKYEKKVGFIEGRIEEDIRWFGNSNLNEVNLALRRI